MSAIMYKDLGCEDLLALYNFCVSNKQQKVSATLELVKGRFIITYKGIDMIPSYITNKKQLFASAEWFDFLKNTITNFQFINLSESEHKKIVKRGGTGNYSPKKTYIMKDKISGYVKIGRSQQPSIRESTLQHEKPTISLFAVCNMDIEKELHRRYIKKRVRGEWFNLTEDETAYIITRYNFNILESHDHGKDI